ncbi:hydroxyacylglutathione hydrolase-like protein [Spea bombifrons]|uniref:hydroxyacylglutathione hydrolase-like protein n=1 Tax=Spea bombifrons TaxID=233779 RepID=UPI00234AA745|nr:hydroxyacylglutathione hydrolase-like protein [Spea bombifrons]XP_053326630.1 hydroxyacylglutathione hydrolase-like protein [Spea bombifrons]
MKVKVISVLDDNYMYLIIEEETKEAFAVDASVAKKLIEIVRKEGANLKAVLTTHHHLDHCRGNPDLTQRFPDLHIYGADDRIGGLTHKLVHNQELKFGGINVRCLFTPCHTSGHMSFFVWEDGCADAPALFSGDTLFVGGCGRFFEGTAEQMYKNLTETLGTLPSDTKIFCGHEYTVRNLKFALKVEPDNERVKEKLAWAKARDEDDIPTVPSSLEEEFHYNPFMRLKEEAVQKFTGKMDPVEVMRVLRKEKDNFKKKEQLPIPAILAFQLSLLSESRPAKK